ncbi:MAG: SIS domain-containing protein, partial [Bacteroidaceae bacterium]|nr:SIS domain-containing protein [Bacteroidaceae bacterium]
LCRIPCEVEYASEFRYRNPVVTKDDVVIAISQSGETADTLAAIQLAKEQGAFIFGICNAIGSSIPRATNTGTYIHVGPEIGVASTKAFTGQVTVLSMLALCLAAERKTISEDLYEQMVKELTQIPNKMEQALKTNEQIEHLAPIFTYAKNCLYLGRGYNYPLALEGALKLKEISYIHAEGYPAAEMKHGPIALIEERNKCWPSTSGAAGNVSFFRVLVVLVVLVKKSPPLSGRAKSSASKRASAHAAGGGDGGQSRCDCCHDDLKDCF